MTGTVMEVIRFRLNKGVDEEDLFARLEPTTRFLATRPGFVRRRLSKDGDGTWLDLVEWQSMDQAKAASDAYAALPEDQRYCPLIDMSSAKLEHFDVMARQEA